MTSRAGTSLAIAAVAWLGIAPPVRPQGPDPADVDRRLAVRAATVDCHRQLAAVVAGIPINDGGYVLNFAAEDVAIRGAVDAFVKSIKTAEPRFLDDGRSEVDADVDVPGLVEVLKFAHGQYYRGTTIKATDFEEIPGRLGTDLVRIRGWGLPRADVPPGYEELVASLPTAGATAPGIPAAWQGVGKQAKLKATRFAEVDAVGALLEQAMGLRLNETALVRDFINGSDAAARQARIISLGGRRAGEYLRDDAPLVELTMEIPADTVLTRIERLYAEHGGGGISAADIAGLKSRLQGSTLRATGIGAPPSRYTHAAKDRGVSVPDWLAGAVTASGTGDTGSDAGLSGRLRAAHAAEREARRRLKEQIHALSADSNTTVGELAARELTLALQLNALSAGAAADPASFEGGTATVKVELPAAAVWPVVHDSLQASKRRPDSGT